MLRGRWFFGIIAIVVWILWVIVPRIGGTAVNKKLGHLLHPGMGLYFLVMALFCLSTAFAGHTGLAAFEALVTAIAFTFYMTRKQYRHRQLHHYLQSIPGAIESVSHGECPFPMAVVRLGDGGVVFANQKFITLTGFSDTTLVQKIQGENWFDFDVVVATPNMMGVVGRLGRVLGPKGLMPNPKSGTVTMDVAKAIAEIKAGKVEYRLDKQAIIHCPIGKKSFTAEQLVENLNTLIGAINRAKPAAAKGTYMKSLVLHSTMGPGIKVNPLKF